MSNSADNCGRTTPRKKHTKESRACTIADFDPDWIPPEGKLSYGVCQVCGRRWQFDDRPDTKAKLPEKTKELMHRLDDITDGIETDVDKMLEFLVQWKLEMTHETSQEKR